MDNILTPLQVLERQALVGNQSAIVTVVSALRRYRDVIGRLTAARGPGGIVDGNAVQEILADIPDIESGE